MTDPRLTREGVESFIKELVDNYPDLDAMVASGALTSVAGGWYEPQTTAAFNAISKYATQIRTSKAGRAQVKLSKPDKRLTAIAAKLGGASSRGEENLGKPGPTGASEG